MGELEQLIKGDHAHMPLSDIIFQLIKMGHMNKALKLKSDFKVPDKRCNLLNVIVASFCSLPMHCVAGFGGSSSKRLQPPTNGVSTAHSSGYMLCLSLFDFRAKLPTWASWKSFIWIAYSSQHFFYVCVSWFCIILQGNFIIFCPIALRAELEKFSKEKRSPIGYEPFVQICLEHGKLAEARRFCTERIDKPSVSPSLVQYMTMCGPLSTCSIPCISNCGLQLRAEYFIKMEDWQVIDWHKCSNSPVQMTHPNSCAEY